MMNRVWFRVLGYFESVITRAVGSFGTDANNQHPIYNAHKQSSYLEAELTLGAYIF